MKLTTMFAMGASFLQTGSTCYVQDEGFCSYAPQTSHMRDVRSEHRCVGVFPISFEVRVFNMLMLGSPAERSSWSETCWSYVALQKCQAIPCEPPVLLLCSRLSLMSGSSEWSMVPSVTPGGGSGELEALAEAAGEVAEDVNEDATMGAEGQTAASSPAVPHEPDPKRLRTEDDVEHGLQRRECSRIVFRICLTQAQ